MGNYEQIFKRKSFHAFRNAGKLTDKDLCDLEAFIKTVRPLEEGIRTEIRVVPKSQTFCMCGADCCILFYSEKKGNYLRNVGYMGQQIDLYCSSVNIGSLWYGMGWAKTKQIDDLEYVIMIAVGRVSEDSFRKDPSEAKRKDVDEIWSGEQLNIAQTVRLTPSAVNSQPWFVENTGNELKVYRVWPKSRGIMPAGKVNFFNRIDIGIFLFILETCLEHEGIKAERTLFEDTSDEKPEKVPVAEYRFKL